MLRYINLNINNDENKKTFFILNVTTVQENCNKTNYSIDRRGDSF